MFFHYRNASFAFLVTISVLAFLFGMCAGYLSPTPALAALGGTEAWPSVSISDIGLYGAQLVLATGLDGLRAQHRGLVDQAAAKMAEVQDGMSADAIAAIEAEHRSLLADAQTVATAIENEERQQRSGGDGNGSAVTAERERVAEIHRLGLRHASVLPADFAADHIRSGTALDQVRAQVLDLVARAAEGTQIINRTQVLRDEGDTVRRAVEDAITLRARPGAIGRDTDADRMRVDAAREWRGMGLMEMGRAYLSATCDVRVSRYDQREQAAIMLGMRRVGGMMATSDFPEILANVASRRLRDAYREGVQTWRVFCRQNNAPDFKERAIVQLNGMPEFKRVREGGEYQRASLAESVEKYSIATFGRILAITRNTLINDDLGAFEKLPTLFGRAAAEFESDTVWGIMLSSPKMGDNIDLFHADHGNLAQAGGDPTEATVEAAEIAMGAQTDAAGGPLNLRPKFLAVSRKHKVKAQKLLTAIGATATGDVNVYANSMDLIVEDRLYRSGAGNTSPWFVIADPAQWDTIEYAYLDGEEGLFTESRQGFDVDGLEIKGRLDFGAKAIDFRGFQKNPGN